jgi:hypothetical protein
MYRVFVLIINIVVTLTVGSIFQSGVTLSIEVPAEVTAGTEFEVHVAIQKGQLESFSRLQQSFPSGLTASAYLSSNADFSSEPKKVRLIWLRLPQENELTLAYKIKVDERLKGTFTIKGLFSYIDNNERKSISAESAQISIQPSKNIDPSLVVDINDFEQKVIPYISPAVASAQVACIRQKPVSDGTDGTYIVNILVNKATKNKFAKIEETIPAGYKAVSVNPKEAIFTYKNSRAKFLWMNLPSDPYFIVSYKLVPVESKRSTPQPVGKFSYLEDEKTFSIDIQQTDKDIASLTTEEVGNLITLASTGQLLTLNEQNIETKETATDENQSLANSANQKKKARRASKERGLVKEPKSNLPYLLEPDSGIYFRVQIAAGHKPIAIERYFKKYSLDKEVRKEYHEGWFKYSIGSFPVYREARDYRVHIWNTTILGDAFVSAYNNGKRITVQEALMVANQKWYK